MKARIPWKPSKSEKKAMKDEINRQVIEVNKQYANDIDAVILYTLHKRFGFGKKRLRQFFEAFYAEYQTLVKYYEMPEACPFICDRELKKIGVDIAEWNKERDRV